MTDSDFGIIALLALPSQLLCPNCFFRLIKFLTVPHSECPGCLWSPLPLAERWSYGFLMRTHNRLWALLPFWLTSSLMEVKPDLLGLFLEEGLLIKDF